MDVVAPRPTSAFVGRQAELARIVEMARDEVLFLVHGVAGIGKTELVYRAFAALGQQPSWADVPAEVLQVCPGMDVSGVIAMLRTATGTRLRRRGSMTAELGDIARAWNARPRLILIDDLHHLEPSAAGMLVGWLARRVSASRLFVTSRAEIPLVVDGITPLVLRLGPLDDADATQLARFLAARRDHLSIDVERCVRRAGGSPDQLRHAVASASLVGGLGGRLEAALDELPGDARALLIRAAHGAALTRHELGSPRAESLDLLARRFFLEITADAVIVREPVRTAALRLAFTAGVALADAIPGLADLATGRADAIEPAAYAAAAAATLAVRQASSTPVAPVAPGASDPVPAPADARDAGTRILVDEQRGTIAGPRGRITGRFRLCALLLSLIDGDGQPVAPDQLYTRGWNAASYDPLRHRGTLYSAINRLRQVLADVHDEPAGDLIQTTPAGWRLPRGVVGRGGVGGDA